jgi:hypothetical protein
MSREEDQGRAEFHIRGKKLKGRVKTLPFGFLRYGWF